MWIGFPIADHSGTNRTAAHYGIIPNLLPDDRETARRFFRKRSRVAIGEERLDRNVGPPPDGNGACKQPAPLGRQPHDTAAPVRRVHRDLKQTSALQWFESGGQRRPVHSESDATAAMSGGSGRFRDIIRENCPFVSPTGRRASSKRRASALAARCTCRQRHASRTTSVVLNVGFAAIGIRQ